MRRLRDTDHRSARRVAAVRLVFLALLPAVLLVSAGTAPGNAASTSMLFLQQVPSDDHDDVEDELGVDTDDDGDAVEVDVEPTPSVDKPTPIIDEPTPTVDEPAPDASGAPQQVGASEGQRRDGDRGQPEDVNPARDPEPSNEVRERAPDDGTSEPVDGEAAPRDAGPVPSPSPVREYVDPRPGTTPTPQPERPSLALGPVPPPSPVREDVVPRPGTTPTPQPELPSVEPAPTPSELGTGNDVHPPATVDGVTVLPPTDPPDLPTAPPEPGSGVEQPSPTTRPGTSASAEAPRSGLEADPASSPTSSEDAEADDTAAPADPTQPPRDVRPSAAPADALMSAASTPRNDTDDGTGGIPWLITLATLVSGLVLGLAVHRNSPGGTVLVDEEGRADAPDLGPGPWPGAVAAAGAGAADGSTTDVEPPRPLWRVGAENDPVLEARIITWSFGLTPVLGAVVVHLAGTSAAVGAGVAAGGALVAAAVLAFAGVRWVRRLDAASAQANIHLRALVPFLVCTAPATVLAMLASLAFVP